jgi:hypothetical protein
MQGIATNPPEKRWLFETVIANVSSESFVHCGLSLSNKSKEWRTRKRLRSLETAFQATRMCRECRKIPPSERRKLLRTSLPQKKTVAKVAQLSLFKIARRVTGRG